ncbi:MAG TPA: ABC transporter substrate-binding protein [Desulfosporosinus sp.]|nr:ABC transporter substrate-binding protein [Desulfosporosinus sp.]
MTSRYFLRKSVTFCGLIAAIFLLVIGCTRAPQTGQPGGPAPGVVEIWHSLQGAEADALQGQSQTIMKSHPEVIIKLKYIPEPNFAAFSYRAEAGGEGPEIFIASKEIIRQLYEHGTLAKIAYNDQEAFPATLSAFKFGGVSYASPWLTDIPLIYFRTDTATVPANLDDLFSSKGGMSLAAADTSSLSAWWNGSGGRLVSAGKPVIDDPLNVAFLKQLLTWQTAKSLRIDPSVATTFAAGGTRFMIAGASQAKSLTEQNIPWGSLQLSDLVGGQGQPLLGSTLGIANSAIKTNEAMSPVIQIVEKALLTPELEGAMMKAGRLLPANMGYYKLPEAQKGVFPQANIAFAKAWALEGNASEWKLIPLQNAAWNNVLTSTLTPEEALARAQGGAIKP